jgi:hypothetical protein
VKRKRVYYILVNLPLFDKESSIETKQDQNDQTVERSIPKLKSGGTVPPIMHRNPHKPQQKLD